MLTHWTILKGTVCNDAMRVQVWVPGASTNVGKGMDWHIRTGDWGFVFCSLQCLLFTLQYYFSYSDDCIFLVLSLAVSQMRIRLIALHIWYAKIFIWIIQRCMSECLPVVHAIIWCQRAITSGSPMTRKYSHKDWHVSKNTFSARVTSFYSSECMKAAVISVTSIGTLTSWNHAHVYFCNILVCTFFRL